MNIIFSKKLCVLKSLLLLVAVILFNYLYVTFATYSCIYSSISAVPENEVALLLGTPRYIDYEEKEVSPYFLGRIKAASDLYKKNKVKKILISGCRRDEEIPVDEPRDMLQELLRSGVNRNDILIDDSSFRTLDSIVRAGRVFGLKSMTVVSQDFHLHRALYICKDKGNNAVGYNAEEDIDWLYYLFIRSRESLARVLMMLDLYILDRQPAVND